MGPPWSRLRYKAWDVDRGKANFRRTFAARKRKRRPTPGKSQSGLRWCFQNSRRRWIMLMQIGISRGLPPLPRRPSERPASARREGGLGSRALDARPDAADPAPWVGNTRQAASTFAKATADMQPNGGRTRGSSPRSLYCGHGRRTPDTFWMF